jgi:hypothetical protein
MRRALQFEARVFSLSTLVTLGSDKGFLLQCFDLEEQCEKRLKYYTENAERIWLIGVLHGGSNALVALATIYPYEDELFMGTLTMNTLWSNNVSKDYMRPRVLMTVHLYLRDTLKETRVFREALPANRMFLLNLTDTQSRAEMANILKAVRAGMTCIDDGSSHSSESVLVPRLLASPRGRFDTCPDLVKRDFITPPPDPSFKTEFPPQRVPPPRAASPTPTPVSQQQQQVQLKPRWKLARRPHDKTRSDCTSEQFNLARQQALIMSDVHKPRGTAFE